MVRTRLLAVAIVPVMLGVAGCSGAAGPSPEESGGAAVLLPAAGGGPKGVAPAAGTAPNAYTTTAITVMTSRAEASDRRPRSTAVSQNVRG